MSRVWSVSLVVCVLSARGAFGLEPDQTWLQWRGPDRSNKSSFEGLNDDWAAHPPKLLWQAKGLGAGYSSVSLDGKRLYTTGNKNNAQHLIAVDLKTHKVAWSVALTRSAPEHGYQGARCTPTIDGDRIYVVTSDGSIACIQAARGKILWQRSFSEWGGQMMSIWGFSESPLIDGDNVLCTPGGPQATMVCLNKKTGKDVWKCAIPDFGNAGKPGAGYSSIVISEACGTKQYVQLVGRGTIGVRASDGQLLWSYNRIANPTANIPTCIVDGDYVFTSSGYDAGGAALLHLVPEGKGIKAEEVYYFDAKQLQNHHGGMVLVGEHLYFGHGHNKGFPVCVDLKSGKTLWNAQRESRDIGSGSAAITYADGHIVFRYQDGPVALVEATPDAFHFKGAFRPEIIEKEAWAQPVIVDGKMYLREQDSLMVYDVAKQ